MIVSTYSCTDEVSLATFSILDAFKKLDNKIKKSYTKNERKQLKSDIDDFRYHDKTSKAFKNLAKSADESAKSALKGLSPKKYIDKKVESRSWNDKSEIAKIKASSMKKHVSESKKSLSSKESEYKEVRNIALAGVAVAALASIGYAAYKIANRKSDKDLAKIEARIKELESKSKTEGGLNKSEADELTSLVKKVSKSAVKVDPKSSEKISKDVESVVNKIS